MRFLAEQSKDGIQILAFSLEISTSGNELIHG
jgi:hypothetical protein